MEEAQETREAAGQDNQGVLRGQRSQRSERNPDDRLLSMLVHAEVEGRPLTPDELLGTSHLLMLGGLDTVTATLDCMIVYLVASRSAAGARRRPALVAVAIEELLRHQTPVMMVRASSPGHRVRRRDWRPATEARC